MKSTNVPFPLLFQFPNNMDSLIVSLRSITSYCLHHQTIFLMDDIFLRPLPNASTKLIELVENDQRDVIYLEHPLSFELLYPNEKKKIWNFAAYKTWLGCCIRHSERYLSLSTILRTFFANEIDSKLAPIQKQLNCLEKLVPGFSKEMVTPFFMEQYQFEHPQNDYMKSVSWESILRGHVEACRVLFHQITSERVRGRILEKVFKIVCILEGRLQKVISNPTKLQDLVLDFKRETNKCIQEEASFVNTNSISFRVWFLSLSQFRFYLQDFQFPIKESLLRLNLILYLCFPSDEVKQDQLIYVRQNKEEKCLSNHEISKLKTIHPFVRNVYHTVYI